MAELYTKRHSLSHIMSQAIVATFPDLTILRGVGPAIDVGFYQDYDFGDFQLTEEHLKEIEKKMKNIIRQNQTFEMEVRPAAECIAQFSAEGDTYKLELAEDLVEKGETTLSFCINKMQDGRVTMVDLCKGPHIEKTSELDENSFKLDRIAGAYWRGDEKNKMLTRIYGFAFENKEELDAYLHQQEEARKRDHRIIGKKLKLFTVSELVGAGLPMLQPNGMTIKIELQDYLWSLHKNEGYQRVWIPHIAKEELYQISGHAGHYMDDMFHVHGGSSKEEFYLKPMNCPHHMQLFADNQWSYRDMPVRYFEPTTVYRDEKSGQLSGLTRVRSITQDDGHLFCRESQIGQEFSSIVKIIKEFYSTMGMLDGYKVRLSLRGEDKAQYLGGDEVWDIAENALRDVCVKEELNFFEGPGEAAFYGPKLDFMFRDAIGREWQLATVQCDFNLPKRFDLSYVNEQGEKERPVVIHRAISGSLERFMGVMIEHFAGNFPLWLAPRQAIVIPVGEKFNDYAEQVLKSLKDAGVRAEADFSGDGLNKKVRNAEQSHINYILVVGEKEEASKGVAVRNYITKEQTEETLASFVTRVQEEITMKKL